MRPRGPAKEAVLTLTWPDQEQAVFRFKELTIEGGSWDGVEHSCHLYGVLLKKEPDMGERIQVWRGEKGEEKKMPKLLFTVSASKALCLDAVDDQGTFVCGLWCWDMDGSGIARSSEALDFLEGQGYDTSWGEWNASGQLLRIK